MERSEFYAELRAFLVAHFPDVDVSRIDEDFDLIDSGVLDSFALTNLVFFVEQLVSAEVAFEELTVDSLRSFRRIYDELLPKDGEAANEPRQGGVLGP